MHPSGDILSNASKLNEQLTEYMKSRITCKGIDIDTAMGYPLPFKLDQQYTQFFQWYGALDPKYKIILNNVGDPLLQEVLPNSHDMENYIIRYFATKLGYDDPTKAKGGNTYWGFISASGTDGNNHGIYYGRKFLAKKQSASLKKMVQPVVYTSKEGHYSIMRMCDLQNLECVQIDTNLESGSINVVELETKIDPTKPAIIMASMGTTMRGGIDDVHAINDMLKKKNLPLGYYIHIDAALFGGYLIYCNPEAVSVSNLGYHSISISGNQFFGCDDPCGIFVTSSEVRDCIISDPIPYLNGCVPTLTCSRSGMTVLKLYYKLNALDISVWIKDANQCLSNARLLFDLLSANKLKVWRMSDLSNIIIIERPPDKIIHKYQLASAEYEPYKTKISHIVVMQHVTQELIRRFVHDLVEALKSK
jgi:histidine decarboxylase